MMHMYAMFKFDCLIFFMPASYVMSTILPLTQP